MALSSRKPKSSKGRRKSRKQRSWGLRWWILGLAAALIVGGVGALKWAKTGPGRAALLAMGSEKMFGDVQTAVDEALAVTLPGFVRGPALLLNEDDPVGGSAAVTAFDWPAPELGPGAEIRCRQIVVPDGVSYWKLQQRITRAVEAVGARVLWGERLAAPGAGDGSLRPDESTDLLRLDVGVPGKPTHTLVLHRAGLRVPPRWDRWPGRTNWNRLLGQGDVPTVALVIDDWGYARTEATHLLLDLPAPLTLAVLPGLSYSRHFALRSTELVLPEGPEPGLRGAEGSRTDARRLRLEAGCPVEVTVSSAAPLQIRRREIILHLPMQPQSYPEIDPGAGAILVGMSDDEIALRLDAALHGLPMVTGVSNHMGSAATADEATMRKLMKQLKPRGLLFLDSLTTARSVAYDLARESGVPALRNRIFLDYDHEDTERIAANLAVLVRSARSTGFAVGIGHPHPATAAVLARELPRWQAEGIRFVTVSELMALRDAAQAGS